MPSNGFCKGVFIGEDQQDVLSYILRSIETKNISSNNIAIAHFNSNADMDSPDLKADQVFDFNQLLANSSAGSWILPLVYAGHVSKVIWFKPPWSPQFTDGVYEFFVGKCPKSGTIKCSCKHNYFITDGMYCPAEKLQNRKPLRFIVLTVGIVGNFSCLRFLVHFLIDPGHPDASSYHESEPPLKPLMLKLPPQKKGNKRGFDPFKPDFDEDSPGDTAIFKKLLGNNDWILDIDLGFFSVQDPVRSSLQTAENMRVYKDLYVSYPPSCNDPEIEAHMERRKQEMSALERWYRNAFEKSMSIPEGSLLASMVQMIKERNVDWNFIHQYGVKCGNAAFPHHPSSEAEINYLLSAVEPLMLAIPGGPEYITIAQSKQDRICPPDQIASIQQSVLHRLKNLFPTLKPVASAAAADTYGCNELYGASAAYRPMEQEDSGTSDEDDEFAVEDAAAASSPAAVGTNLRNGDERRPTTDPAD